MRNLILAAGLLLAFSAHAGNDNSNPCGNNGNNCNPSGGDASAYGGSANAGAVSVAGAAAGAVAGAHSSIGDVTNIAAGGQGGKGGDGGNAIAISEGGKGGQSYAAGGTALGGSSSNDLSNANDNRSAATGNQTHTNVSTLVERNAPPVYLGNIAATVSCAGGFNAGSSSQGGSGAFGFTWISPDCKQVVAAQNMQSLGMVDVACRIFKSTDGYKRAARRDPSLKDVSCSLAK